MTDGVRVRIVLFAAVVAAAGVGCAAKPYARDPLVTDGRAVRGDRAAAARPGAPAAEPATPDAPAGPTVGDPALATSP